MKIERYIFMERTSNDAPFTIRDGDVLTNPMPYFDKANFKYRNAQLLQILKMLLTHNKSFLLEMVQDKHLQ